MVALFSDHVNARLNLQTGACEAKKNIPLR